MENNMETSGFYKLDGGTLLYGPNTVMGSGIDLIKEHRDLYEYPVSDWYWFDSEEDAKLFFGITDTKETDNVND